MGISYDPTILLLGYMPRAFSFYVLYNRMYIRHEIDMYKNVNSNIFNNSHNGNNPNFR